MAKRKGKVGFLGLTNKTWMWVGVGVVGYYLLKPKSTTNGSTGTPSTGPTRNGGGLTTTGSNASVGAIDNPHINTANKLRNCVNSANKYIEKERNRLVSLSKKMYSKDIDADTSLISADSSTYFRQQEALNMIENLIDEIEFYDSKLYINKGRYNKNYEYVD